MLQSGKARALFRKENVQIALMKGKWQCNV